MAVEVTDNRVLVDEADSLIDWSSPEKGESPEVYEANPNPVESTGCIGMAVSTETSDLVHTLASPVNLANTLVYVWTLANGTMDTRANGGVAIILSDVTPDRVGYHLAGSDVAGFRHESGPVGWQCLLLDTSTLPTSKTQLSGTVDPDLAGITEIGAMYKTLSKALGGGENCFTDVIRYGNGGLTITAGTSEDTGKFSEIAADDRANTSGKAYGILRELGVGLYGLQGPLTFGDTAGETATYFKDTNATVVFEDRGIATDKYSVTIQGNGIGSTTFQLGEQVGGTTSGSSGCSLVCPSGVGASFTAIDTDLQFLYLFGSSFSGFSGGASFSTDATNGPNHKIYDCSFFGCGQIDPGKTQFKNCSISSSTNANGSVLLNGDGTSSWADLSFTSDGTGHAIYITATGEYTFTNFTYANFGADENADACMYNNSGGGVTINKSGGDFPTVRNGSGASTQVVDAKTLTITVQDKDTDPIQNVQTAIYKVSDRTELMNKDTDIDGVASESYGGATPIDVEIRCRKASAGETKYKNFSTLATITGDFDLLITLLEDPYNAA